MRKNSTPKKPARLKTAKARKASCVPAMPAPEAKPPAVTPAAVIAGRLEIVRDGRTDAELLAESGMSPTILNALIAMNSTRPTMAKGHEGSTGIMAYAKVMASKVQTIVSGDMSEIEATCAAQVLSLNALYSDLAVRAQTNIHAGHLEAGEIYLRLAFKAQSQCRASAETLGELKNPRPIFAKNFNLANGNQQVNTATGPQQVNNGANPDSASHAGEKNNSANKLLGAG